MSECKQCPHVIGDADERDCGFPDCMGGWEEAYKDRVKKITQLQAQVKALEEVMRGLQLHFKHHLDRLEYQQTGLDPKTNGFAYAKIPDWDLKQQLEDVEQALKDNQ